MAQLNDLIVTGRASFLNEIKGKIDWTNILNKPSTFTPTIGTSATTAMAGNTNVNNVTQTATTVTSDTKYELLFSNTADNTNRTEGTRKSSLLTFSPNSSGVELTMNYDGSRPNNYGDITINGNNNSDSYITLHSSSAGMSYMWIKHPSSGVGIFLEGGSDSSSSYSKGMISADDFVVSGHDWEGNNITWNGYTPSLKTALTNLGTLIDSGASTTFMLNSGDVPTIASIPITAGAYIFWARVFFTQNSIGRRYIEINNKCKFSIPACTDSFTCITGTYIDSFSGNDTAQLKAFQSSGTNIELQEIMFQAIKLA